MNTMNSERSSTTTMRPGTRSRAGRTVGRRDADVLIMQIESDRQVLNAPLAETLRQWTDDALRRYGNGMVVMAGTPDLTRMGRVSMLSELRNLVVARGFAGDRVRYMAEALPDCAAKSALVLRVISSRQAEAEVQSICGLLENVEVDREALCTSAS